MAGGGFMIENSNSAFGILKSQSGWESIPALPKKKMVRDCYGSNADIIGRRR
jgi:hypothetical protein